MVEEKPSYSSAWSWEQDKAFENALATVPEDASDRWERIASAVPGKSVEDIKIHYEILVEDIDAIEAGRVTLPSYISSENSGEPASEGGGGSSKKVRNSSGNSHGDSNQSGKASRSDQERRKGIAWTEEEHRLFLLGLDKYGKGDWRSISRNFVVSRTPTQVASHAQKYFIRLNSMNKDRRRSSIHDITSVPGGGGGGGDVSAPQGPITGQAANLPAAASSGKPAKPSSKVAPPPPLHGPCGVGIYGGTTIGQPVVGGPLASAVGTPVTLSAPPPYMAYGVRAPVVAAPAGDDGSGAPLIFPPMSYPIGPPMTRGSDSCIR